jgi:hypothetical protein
MTVICWLKLLRHKQTHRLFKTWKAKAKYQQQILSRRQLHIFFFLSLSVWPHVYLLTKNRRLLLHRIVLHHTHTHTRTNTNTHTRLGLSWNRDRTVAEKCTWQITTLIREIHSCPRRDTNPQFQQASDRRPKPYTVRP